MRRAVERLEIPWAVAIDTELEVWDIYGNEGWPARYLWDRGAHAALAALRRGRLRETEREIQALLGVEREPLAPLRPEDAPDALIAAQTEDQPGAYSRPLRGGRGVGGRRGRGRAARQRPRAGGRRAGLHPAGRARPPHGGELALEAGAGRTVHATCFTPGVA